MKKHWLELFTVWWNKHGGNADLCELSVAYRAGWLSAIRQTKKEFPFMGSLIKARKVK